MLLNGFGFSGYRSFGNELTLIAPLKKINFIIGQNNSGKSNIIKFLHEQMGALIGNIDLSDRYPGGRVDIEKRVNTYSLEDYPYSKYDNEGKIAFPVSFDHFKNQLTSKKLPKRILENIISNYYSDGFKRIFDKVFLNKHGYIWFVYKWDAAQNSFDLDLPDYNELIHIVEKDNLIKFVDLLTDHEITSIYKNNITFNDKQKILEAFQKVQYFPKKNSIPKVQIIPAIRKIALIESNQEEDFSGLGLINKLAKIQNPPFNEQEKKNKFELINIFVQVVLENSTAKIEIPYERDMILVHMDGKTLPLESLGTGVHEVIIIAAAATLLDKAVVCIEEPELHLHPVLQRKLINYLSKNTNNQYFFTTHSAHLLDAVDDAQIFYVTLENGQSHVEVVSTTKQKSNICKNLGYKASDLLQTNCIIWVEGPSDRIYINYWIKGKRSDLIEGIHYSIMFYGGRLASHLTGLDDDEKDNIVKDFIKLRSLNSSAVIVMDSDKEKSNSKINETKRRLQLEFDKKPGFAWITKGREIENYLDHDKVETCVLQVHSESAEKLVKKGQWNNLLKYTKKKKNKESNVAIASKVKVAEKFIENYKVVEYQTLDLNKMVNKLISFILECNDKK